MKRDIVRFCLKLFVVSAFTGVLIFYCELRLRAIPNTFTQKKNYFEQKLDSIQILILGSSESICGINPSYLSKCGYNLASGSQSLYYDTELTLKYIDKMPKLEYVLISITYFSLWYETYSGFEDWRDFYYYHFWDVPMNTPKIFDLKHFSYIALYGTDFSQVAFMKNFKISGEEETIMKSGWARLTDSMVIENADRLGESSIQRHNDQSMDDEVLENNIKYLDRLLSEISKRKLTPVLVSTPVFYSYSSRMDSQRIKTINEITSSLCNKYYCSYLNFQNNPDFIITDFADPVHLNFKGAEKLTRLINSRLLSESSSN